MNKREQLQKIVDEAINHRPDCHPFSIEWRGRGGWWAIPEDPRYFGDKGEHLGQDFAQAKRNLLTLLP